VEHQQDLAAAMSLAANLMMITGYFGVIKALLERDLSAKGRDPPSEGELRTKARHLPCHPPTISTLSFLFLLLSSLLIYGWVRAEHAEHRM
jgi:hypothetical protein